MKTRKRGICEGFHTWGPQKRTALISEILMMTMTNWDIILITTKTRPAEEDTKGILNKFYTFKVTFFYYLNCTKNESWMEFLCKKYFLHELLPLCGWIFINMYARYFITHKGVQDPQWVQPNPKVLEWSGSGLCMKLVKHLVKLWTLPLFKAAQLPFKISSKNILWLHPFGDSNTSQSLSNLSNQTSHLLLYTNPLYDNAEN